MQSASRSAGWRIVLAVAACAPLRGGQAAPTEPDAGRAAFRFGEYRTTIAGLDDPVRAVIGPDELIYVAEAGAGRISVFDADGARRRSFGSPGPAPGQLVRPRGLAFGPDGALYVADTGNHRVQAFRADGAPLRQWGGYGSADGAFNEPHDLAVRGDRVYVADVGNHRVQVFDRAGAHVASFGRYGHGDGSFSRPVAVAVADDGALFVADADNNRVQKFDSDGAFVASWGDWGPFRGLMDEPSDLVARGRQLYVTDQRNHRVQIYDAAGALQTQWGIHAIKPHAGEGELHYPSGLAIAPSGSFGVVCETFENRCQIFAAAAADRADEALADAQKASRSHFGERIGVDGLLLTMAEPETHRVHVFETSGTVPVVIGSFGERGTSFGQLIRAGGLEIDLDTKRLLVSDTATRRIQEYTLNYEVGESRRFDLERATFARAFDLARLGAQMGAQIDALDARWVIEPSAIRCDPSGHVYVVDPRNSLVLVFDPEMAFVPSWGGYGIEPGQFRQPNDLAFGRDGDSVFVVDADNHRVQVFDRAGRPLRSWGAPGDGPGEFKRPFGIAAGRDGFVYVTDAAAHRVQKFTEDGAFVAAWGTLGIDHGEFWKPKGIVQDDRMRVIVVDHGNHRAQIFAPDGTWQVTFGTGRSYTKEQIERRRRRTDEEGQ